MSMIAMQLEATPNICTVVQIAWVLIAIIWVIKRGDELPLLISVFLAYLFSFRFWALLWGWTGAVDLGQFGFQSMSFQAAIEVFSIATAGETALLAAYLFNQKAHVYHGDVIAQPELLTWLRSRVFALAGICIPIALLSQVYTHSEMAAGKVMAFESSAYIYLFPFSLISVAILLAILWKAGGLYTPAQIIGSIVVVCFVAALTFQSGARFQFLGWILASTFIMSSGLSLQRKTILLTVGIFAGIALFAVAGALRKSDDPEADLQQSAWERFVFAEDANMLDGFVILREVYPTLLPFDYGRAHLEILERPIPRAWWPDKPVGGYMNKLGLTSIETGGTLGISPSLFGSFYQEGATVAVVLLSLFYGTLLGKIVCLSTRISPVAGVLIRGIVCAFIIPLLRGGDLPGIYAWGFMSFWPCFLFLWLKRQELFRRDTQSVIGPPLPLTTAGQIWPGQCSQQ